jgi:uncharacterized protein YbjT (DUF2867 family)
LKPPASDDGAAPAASHPRAVLVVGASGLIGSAVVARFVANGVSVRALARRPGVETPLVSWHAVDLAALTTADAWLPHLANVAAVINCAGAMQGGAAALETVHVESAGALFVACERAGVPRVVHLSAIGADREPLSAFSASKRRAERALMASPLEWVILRPSVVVGRAAYGGSALLRALAALPFTPVLHGAGPLQIVQLDELVTTIVELTAPAAPARLALDVAGPERLSFVDAIRTYRAWLRLPPAPAWQVPRPLLALAHLGGDLVAHLGWRPPLGSMARRELVRGAVGDAREWREVTGIEPLPLATALAREPASVQERWFAKLYFLKAAVLGVLVAFWIATGVISLGPGWDEGTSYLREGGVPESLTRAGVIAGALADIAVGVGIAVRRTAKLALLAAAAISIFYMVAGTFVLPRLWVDPVGPMLKIWPILVLILVALAIIDDR